MPTCKHKVLRFEPSEHAKQIGFQWATEVQRSDATRLDGRPSAVQLDVKQSTFPGPIVLPGDELSFDPAYEPQDVDSWSGCVNFYTPERRVVYLVPTPTISAELASLHKDPPVPNLEPVKKAGRGPAVLPRAVASPKTEIVLDYLSAFYDGMAVKVLNDHALSFVEWKKPSRARAQPDRIGLNIGKEVIGVRVRPSQDKIFDAQLNLDDILDAAIAILPKYAHALLMMVDHDLYEDEDEDFCCGRAYGGSRVAVVSTARYNPALDKQQEIETEHAWPASHCQEFIEACCEESDSGRAKKKAKSTKGATLDQSKSAMHSAVRALHPLLAQKTPAQLSDLWLGRVCKTASHELGHCFGMDHCVYYARVMQGTSGLTEDAGQPPYLCPVDLAKLFRVTGSTERSHDQALLAFCERFRSDKLFAAFAAWLRVRLAELEDVPATAGSSLG